MEVSIVIPTYNEAENIEDLIKELKENLESYENEIIIVDDGSPDGTADIVEDLEEYNLTLIERKRKSGIGSAYKEGFIQAEGEIIVQMDADFSHRPNEVPDLINEIENTDSQVAVGSRYVQGGDRNDPLTRRIFPLIGSKLYYYTLRSPVKDVTSGFKAYKRDILQEALKEPLPDGFHFQAASLFTIIEKGYKVTEVPIDFRPRRAGEPKYELSDLIDNLKLYLKLFIRRNSVF